jgi:hypothetical protein
VHSWNELERARACRYDKSLVPADTGLPAPSGQAEQAPSRNEFNFEIAWVKAQPVRTEPTMVLVSCAAAAGADAAPDADAALLGAFAGPESNVLGSAQGVNERRVALKRRGEASLRASGLGYCIVRPSALLQEPGGYRALVFDQGDRINQVRTPTWRCWVTLAFTLPSALLFAGYSSVHSPSHAPALCRPPPHVAAMQFPPRCSLRMRARRVGDCLRMRVRQRVP